MIHLILIVVRLIVVRKPWTRMATFDSYTKTFATEQDFLEWWMRLPENSFTRTHCEVTVFEAKTINALYNERI